MSEVLVSNLIEYRDVVALVVWWLYPKITEVSVRGSITFTFGEKKETKDDEDT